METDASDLLRAEAFLIYCDLVLDPDRRDLVLWLDAAQLSDEETPLGSGDARLDAAIGPVHRVETEPGCLRYRVHFPSFVAYRISDDSIAHPEPAGADRAPFRRHFSSGWLETLLRDTGAADVLDAPLWHYEVLTEDYILDIATTELPGVTARMIAPNDPGRPPHRAGRL